MSSGSNAVTPRKPNVASTLFKPASSTRFQLHGQAGSKSMKRQRPGGGASYDRDVLSAESVSNAAALLGERRESVSTAGVKSKKRFVGVRQRPSGRWVAEIKDTTQKIRLWLGTFDSAEEGAKAYDSAARALRGANTRTNFVPAMACEGTTAPASKAARLIRLRQMTAASKEAARNADHHSSLKGRGGNVKEEPQVNDSPAQMVRQELQQSTVSSLDPSLPSPAIIDDHTPNLPPAPAPAPAPSSPPKPPRLIGRRHYVAPQLASPNPEQEGDDDAPPFAPDHGTVDNGSPCMKLEVVDPPPKLLLESQQSVTSNAINPNLIASSRQDSSSPPPLSFPSPRSPFDCVQQPSCTFMADGGTVQSVNSSPDHLKERFLTHPSPVELSFAPVAPPIPNFHALEASRQLMFRSDNNIISGLVAFSHHQLSSCATNRDHMSMTYSREKDEVGRSLRSSMDHGPMSLGDGIVTTERRASTVRCCNEEMDYGSSEICRMEVERKSSIDRAILREKEFGELQEPEIPWADYVLMDETGMDSGLLGLDLSCENSGVYNSAFDFSVEAIDRDSCTSVMLEHEHLSDDSEFLLRMQYEQSCNSPNQSTFPQGCVLLTEPNSERDFTMSSTPQEPAHSLPMLWHMDDASACWDGQSSGSTETIVDLKPTTGDGDGGECTSQDHEALWSSMDLPPLCMVA